MNHSKNSLASKKKQRRDVDTNRGSTSNQQDPSILQRNVHTIGTNSSNNNHPQPQQQQPQPRSSRTRRLSYPTLQHHSSSLTSRIQPLSIIAGVSNEANSSIGSNHHIAVPKMNSNNDINRPQTASSNISKSTHRHGNINTTPTTLPVAGTIPQPHQQRSHNNANNNNSSRSTTTATTTTTTTTQKNPPQQKEEESQLYNFIVSLSESCRKHHNSAHTRPDQYDHDHDHHDTSTGIDDELSSSRFFCIPLTNAPTYCQDAIHTLQRILPHIETTLQNEIIRIADTPSTTTTTTATTITTNDPSPIQQHQEGLHLLRVMTLHMCDFYNDVVQQNGNCGFCPQAPHLLLHPQQILPRVYLLFHCLAAHAKLASSSFWEEEESISQLMKMCRTIAILLNHIPYTSLIRIVISDLIYLSKDLSIWYEMQYAMTQSTNVLDASMDQLKISLFEETVEMIDWSKYHADNGDGTNSKTHVAIKPEYIIHIPSTSQSIQVLQWYTLIILEHLLTLNKQGRHSPSHTTCMIMEEMDPTYYYSCMGCNPDLFITLHIEVEDLRTLLIPFRQIILSSPLTSSMASACYSLNIVSRILILIQSDWHRSCVPNLSLLEEVALLIGYGVRLYLELLLTTPEKWNIGGLLDDTISNTMKNMELLVSELIYNPPNVAGSLALDDVTVRIHQMCYVTVLESVPYILRLSKIQNRTMEPNHYDPKASTLSTLLLRTILAIQSGIAGARSFWHKDLIRPLFQLLDDRFVTDITVFILSGIVLQSKQGKSLIVDLEDALKIPFPDSLAIRHEPDLDMQDDVTVGSKRQSVQQSTNTDYPQKRSKNDTLWDSCFDREVFSLHDELLQCFDKNICEAISRLKADLSKSNAAITDALWSDFLHVTRRFQLVLLLIQHEESVTCLTLSAIAPSLARFVNDSLSLISDVSHRLMQVEVYQHDSCRDTIILQFVKHVVICGIFIDKCVWLKSSGFQIVNAILQSALFLAYRWEVFPSCYEDSDEISNFEVPTHLHNVLFGFAHHETGGIKKVIVPQRTWIINTEFFMMQSVTINAQNLACLVIHWAGPFLKPMTDDSRNQNFRLTMLFRPQHKSQVESTAIEHIQTRSRDALQRASWNHPNPLRRLIFWQIGAWLIQTMAPQELHSWSHQRIDDGNSIGKRLLNFLIDTAFLDGNATVQMYTSRELGKILSCKKWNMVLALLSTNDEWNIAQNLGSTFNANDASSDVVLRLFSYIDSLFILHGDDTIQQNDNPILELFHKSAARTLCSLCFAKPHSLNGPTKILIECSIELATRQWSKFYQPSTRRVGLDGFYFAALLSVAHCTECGVVVLSEKWSSIAPIVVRELFKSNSSGLVAHEPYLVDRARPSWKERQFSAFSTFILAIITGRLGGESHLSLSVETDLEKLVDTSLPSIIAELVAAKDYDGLQLMASYKLFVLGQKRSLSKHLKRMESLSFHSDLISGFVIGCVSMNFATRVWNREIENHTRQLCLAPGLVEQIIPLIFMRSGGDELNFFTDVVLQKKISLKQLVTSREMLTLKNFVLELGRNPEYLEPMVVALKKAAAVRSENFDDSSISLFDNSMSGSDDAVKSWVTQNFMFLLVNVVQYKWSTKAIRQQIASLTSLLTILNFLQSAEASQYLPQIMATVTTALSDTTSNMDPCDDASQSKKLRLLAVQVLSKFVKLMAHSQLEVLGQNLTSVVVSLLPTLANFKDLENHVISDEERHGVLLLEWLSSQESLYQYFEEIPFLPPTPSLDTVRARLKARGIHFDSLLIASTDATSTHDGTIGTRSVASDVGSTSGDSRGAASNAIRQAALRRRLEVVSPLLDNDSSSVRRVALQHLTSLLRSNRELFHSLIENEGTTSIKKFVTVLYRDKNGKSQWNITDFIHVLLSRCLNEADFDTRNLLATCFGEVGAISANLLEESEATNETSSRKPTVPPWYYAPHLLGLQLVTTQLVAALKAAPSSSDQHKIAFAIQQLLALLNEAGKAGNILGKQNGAPAQTPRKTITTATGNVNKPIMDESLIRILVDAGVVDVVEPFWFSEFHEAEASAPKPFPFFRSSSTYYTWLSNWCRYMIHRAYDNRKTEWTILFHSCRTALRTNAGLGVADCLLPYLVLDCLCFGSGIDRAMLLSEMRDVLTCDPSGALMNETMALTDRQNAVSKIFGVIDSLQLWIEPEADARFSRRFQSPTKGNDPTQIASSFDCDWNRDESAMRIEDMMSELPLYIRGKASFNVGMHANALRCLEMASRSSVATKVFGPESLIIHPKKQSRSRAAGSCPKEAVALLKDVLASLNDYETIASLTDDNVWDTPKERARDSIRQKEALHDWQGALHDYERAQQLSVDDPSMRTGILKCLLELGHFDSVLQQVKCMKSVYNEAHANDIADAVPLAVEAAWRLGRWETLSELVEVETADFLQPDASYQVHLGKALLCLQRKQREFALLSLTHARSAVMDGLGNVARESYSRSYGHVVKLQAIREIEDVSNVLCSSESTCIGQFTNDSNLSWNRRLELVSSLGAASIMNTRLVLARLSNDTTFEGSLFLQMGKRARKNGLFVAAGNAFSQAEAALRCVDGKKTAKLKSSLQLQIAKLKYESGESSIALRMLGQEDIEAMGTLREDQLIAKSCKRTLESLGIADHGMDEKEVLNIFVRSALQSTRWMIDGGLKEGAEIVARFRIIHCLAPTFEKGHFQFAKYVDSLLQSRILALHGRVPDRVTGVTDEKLRNLIVSRDKACIRYVVLAVRHYTEALILDVKHVYQALPRLLSLWFDFTSIPSQKLTPELNNLLDSSKDEINAFMASSYRKISAQSLYTAIPQLISRIIHEDVDTASVVQAILRRVLTKYPAQAMWPLAWIRQSRDPQRKQIGVDIFSQVTDTLVKSESLHKLLVTSSTLIDYLYTLARKEVSDKIKDAMKVRPLSAEVDLCEFVPPIQAALSASLVSGDSSRTRDIFPRHIPRMRAIDEIAGVMASKARPKKIRVYVVAADSIGQIRVGTRNCRNHDIGEIHFLLKQEVKGDLRKDARVQDLNNVINRIMSSKDTTANGVFSQSRRLHLRTFCVTCLSEETGLLEWVPHTASLRSMIAKTYNPQADSIYGKRQGKRITNFTDPQMRTKFENICQAAFFVSGDLTKAAALFEQECLSAYPPILYWWYVLQFPDPHAWYEARTRFALSTAAWSAVGHVIGLGDRHSENILLDKTSGECVHVDFDCIFDKGLYLPKPEVVPFRLTQNMVDALGPTGADGIYSWNLKAAMSALRDNRDTLLSVLEPFVKDPVINWKRYRSQQRASYLAADHDPSIEAKQKMSVIDERLRGIYNLRNINMRKIRRIDRIENQQDDELRHPIPLSVEGQVHKMIAEATSAENLVQLYVGWMPWV